MIVESRCELAWTSAEELFPFTIPRIGKMQGMSSTERVNFNGKDKSSLPSTLKRPLSASDFLSRKRLASETVLKIVSASYGPSEGHRLSTGELSSDEVNSIPFTRDVAPFLKALLVLRKSHDERDYVDVGQNGVDSGDESSDLVRITGRKRNVIPLMGGRRMNTIFGDPCPGTSKRLRIHYVSYESIDDGTSRASSASEVHRVTFAEHDHVVLRPRLTYYQDDITLRRAVAAAISDTMNEPSKVSGERQGECTLMNAKTLGRAQSIAEFTESFRGIDLGLRSQAVHGHQDNSPQPARTWRLRSATSEIALPIVLPFLTVREKVQCKLVCKVWRNLIQYLGVARTIDINDDTTFPNFTLPIFRGLLAHSHHSLQSLFLNGFGELTKDDLHPSIPHLRKLECLDISRCNDLDDSTLVLLSIHVALTLEVFYLKGLRNVTDRGMMAIAQSCVKLQVLEISNLPITDESGVGIGQNLHNLRALYMRDNYLLTNKSVDLITEKCTLLSQLTLWGCTRLRHLSFHTSSGLTIGCGKLVILNLWGCHSLTDESASALQTMKYLRSLIVSECQKLTNTFLVSVCLPLMTCANSFELTYQVFSSDWLNVHPS